MEIITKYKATDGVEFNQEKNCRQYERLLKKIAFIMDFYEKDLNYPNFCNGYGYIQQEKFTFNRIRIALLHINQAYEYSDKIEQMIYTKDYLLPEHSSHVIRQYAADPIFRAWSRINCTDNKYREWGQPFYRYHSDRAEHVCFNKKPDTTDSLGIPNKK